MNILGIGINGDSCGRPLSGGLTELEDALAYFDRCGFDAVELPAKRLDVVFDGRVQQRQVDRVRDVLEHFDFTYSVHAPDRLNLAFPPHGADGLPELAHEQDVFAAFLDFAAAIGAGVMVYHSGLIALHEAAFGLASLPDDEALKEAREREVLALCELMPLAAERNVVVAMENRDPHPWEVATLVRAGVPPDQLPKYHAGMAIPDLVRQVEAVNHPHLGLTLDLGHLFLAASYCRFDYLEAIGQAAPYVCHLHGSDNFGRLGSVFDGMADRISHGDGDLHMPPGWGAIPYVEALAQLPDYEGLCILEMRPRFCERFPEILEVTKRIVHDATG
jgi:sugar phosphate isomerase/epimerase